MVNLDVTICVQYKGQLYHADLNETYLVGNVSEEDGMTKTLTQIKTE